LIALQRLHAARTKDQLVDALWDLRDSAYDSPEVWSQFNAEAFFQGLASEMDQVPADDSDRISALAIAQALWKALDPGRTLRRP